MHPGLAQHREDAADVGIHAVEVHAPRAEIAAVALHGLGHARLGHAQQVPEGIRQRRAHHLAQVRVRRHLQPHLVHRPPHRGDDALLRVKERAVQIKHHRVIGENVHSDLLYRMQSAVCRALRAAGNGDDGGAAEPRPRGSGCGSPVHRRMSRPRPVARERIRLAGSQADVPPAPAGCALPFRGAAAPGCAGADAARGFTGGCPARPRRMRPAVSRTRATPARERMQLAVSRADVRPAPAGRNRRQAAHAPAPVSAGTLACPPAPGRRRGAAPAREGTPPSLPSPARRG